MPGIFFVRLKAGDTNRHAKPPKVDRHTCATLELTYRCLAQQRQRVRVKPTVAAIDPHETNRSLRELRQHLIPRPLDDVAARGTPVVGRRELHLYWSTDGHLVRPTAISISDGQSVTAVVKAGSEADQRTAVPDGEEPVISINKTKCAIAGYPLTADAHARRMLNGKPLNRGGRKDSYRAGRLCQVQMGSPAAR